VRLPKFEYVAPKDLKEAVELIKVDYEELPAVFQEFEKITG